MPPKLPRELGSEGPLVVVLAGPNGAGKTTFFELYLEPTGLPFVNADRLARVISPEAPSAAAYQAAAAAAAERRRRIAEGKSFAAETVFSDPTGEKIAFLREARRAGFAVVLVFIGLESSELCTARVAQRVEEGGHDVPDEKILARYPRTLANLREALSLADVAYLYDNSSCDAPYRLVARYRNGRVTRRGGWIPAWAEGLPGLEPRRPRRGGAAPATGRRKAKRE